MKKLTVFFTFILFFTNIIFVSHPYAQTENIEAVEVAKELAEKAEGVYIDGESLPALGESQVALPVIDEGTGKIIGYIIADRGKLIKALNESGLTEVANALGAADAGAAAGETVATGISGGSMTTVALIIGAIAAVAVGLGGGGGGGTPTSIHP